MPGIIEMRARDPAEPTPPGDKAPGSLASRLFWFVALWAGGVAAVGAVSFVLRRLLVP